MPLSIIDRSWVRGYIIATTGMKKMLRADVASWHQHLSRLPIQDQEAQGMIGALEVSGALDVGAKEEASWGPAQPVPKRPTQGGQ